MGLRVEDLPDLEEQLRGAASSRRCANGCASTSTASAGAHLPTDLLERVTGGALDPGPYLAYLEAKLDASAQLMS